MTETYCKHNIDDVCKKIVNDLFEFLKNKSNNVHNINENVKIDINRVRIIMSNIYSNIFFDTSSNKFRIDLDIINDNSIISIINQIDNCLDKYIGNMYGCKYVKKLHKNVIDNIVNNYIYISPDSGLCSFTKMGFAKIISLGMVINTVDDNIIINEVHSVTCNKSYANLHMVNINDYIKNNIVKYRIEFYGLYIKNSLIYPLYKITNIYLYKKVSINDNNKIIKLGDVMRTNLLTYIFPKYLSLQELYKLAKIKINTDIVFNKKVYNIIHNLIITKITTKLKEIISMYNKFKYILELSNGIISGSFIMHILHNDDNYRDIDIFFKCKEDYEMFHQYVIKHNILYLNAKRNLHNEYSFNLNGIIYIYNYDNKPNPTVWIQVIILNNIDQREFIKNTFDMDIIKNQFYYKNGNPMIQITNLEYIVNKYTNLNNVNSSFDKIWSRIHKYSHKKITFDSVSCINVMKQYTTNKFIFLTNKYDEKYNIDLMKNLHNEKIISNHMYDKNEKIISNHMYDINGENINVNSFVTKCTNCILCPANIIHYHTTNKHDLLDNNQLIDKEIEIIHIKNLDINKLDSSSYPLLVNNCNIVTIDCNYPFTRKLTLFKI